MKSFKQFLEILDEAKHYVDPDEHERLINLHHSEVSKTNGHNNYEDRVGHAVKKTTLSSHSPEVVKRVLDNFSQGSNTWVRRKAAEHPDLHHPDHKEILDRLMNDPSGKVRELASAPRKGAKEAPAAAPKAEKPAAAPAPKKEAPAAAPKSEKPAASRGTYSSEKVDPEDTAFAGARRVTHILHNGKVVGASVSSEHGSDYGSVPRHTAYVGNPNKGFKPVSAHNDHVEAAKGVVAAHRGK